MTKWPMVPLGEVLNTRNPDVEVCSDGEYPFAGVYCFGGGAFVGQRKSGLEFAYKRLTRLHTGDFTYPKLMAWEGAFAVVPPECEGLVVSTEFPVFSIDRAKAVPEFIGYYFKRASVWPEVAGNSTGTNVRRRRLHPSNLLKHHIPLPPLRMQQQLVEYLDALSAKIEEAQRLREQSSRESEALLTAVIGNALDAVPFQGTLSEVLRDQPRNGWSPNCDGLETGTAVLSLGAVTGFSYRRDHFKWTSEPTNEKGHYWLSTGDLLMSRSNTPDLVGHAAIYDGLPTPCIYPDLMMKLDVDESKADRRFVHLVLQSRLVRDFIKTNSKGTSPTMKKISQGIVMAVPFPSHLGLMEQQVLTDRILHSRSKVLELKESQSTAGRELETLMPGVLDQVFTREGHCV